MLWFIGIGINGYRGLSVGALDVLNRCDIVYVERFTSAISDNDLRGLNSLLGKQTDAVKRWFVEDGREILENAKLKEVALVTYGDPLIATTHSELRTRAAKNFIKTGVLHSASGITSIIGETGLHTYKFGRMVTMMSEPQSAISVYNTIFDNLLSGSHTLILTEYRQEENRKEVFFLDPTTVFKMLLDAENNQGHHIFSDQTFAIIASRIGMESQNTVSGKVRSLVEMDYGDGPHSVIITGPLHFTESESLASLTNNVDPPTDNSQDIKRISAKMIENYAPKAKQAVRQMREIIIHNGDNNKGMFEVLDNAEYYIADAERFLLQTKFELAILSIGYAEGLVDALRFQKGINPWNIPD